MAVLQVEVVVGAIEVGGHHGNIVGAVLQVIALAHLQAGYLGNGVLLVGVLQRAGEQAVLLHGLRCILGIDAGGAQKQEFLNSVRVGLTDHVALDLHVHHNEVRTVEHIGHNATHKGSGQHHCIGLLLVKERLDRVLVRQVQLLMAAAHQVIISSLLEVIPYGRTHKAIVACHVYFTLFV